MSDKYLLQSIFLFLLVIVSLFLLSWIPPFTAAGLNYKAVDLLSDVRETPSPDSLVDSTVATTKPPPADTCRNTVPCIVDYSEEKTGLKDFFAALEDVKRKPVRIAFFGDSFIEGDILTSSFRDTLQQIFGGRGVGYVPITSEVSQFRTTIGHQFSGYETYSIVNPYNEEPVFGISGHCFVPGPDNFLEYKPGRGRSALPPMRVFYTSETEREAELIVNDTLTRYLSFESTTSLSQLLFSQRNTKSIQIKFPFPDSLKLYGVSFEDAVGVYVDNFSLRGNSGMGFFRIPSSSLREAQRLRQYKLIILQFGLNVVTEKDTKKYQGYANQMVSVVSKLKKAFPGVGILLISVSDRSSNQNGKFATMPSIIDMRNAQQEIARRSGIMFWDLFKAMGGRNSMLKYSKSVPPLASKDFTHLTFRGGKVLARKLADAILFERKKDEKDSLAL